MKDYTYKTEIVTTHHCKDNGEIVSVERRVTVDGEAIYNDTLSEKIYRNSKDILKKLEEWIGTGEYDPDFLTGNDYKAIVDALIKSGDIRVQKYENSIEVQDNDYNTLVEIKNHKS